MILETLYAKNSNDKITVWNISVINNGDFSTIITETGYINGVQTKHEISIKNGKNIGKKNETTHFEQAISQDKSKWNKK